MKVKVSDDLCIGCGACAAICDEVFEINDEGMSELISDDISNDMEDYVKEAIEYSPTGAIIEE